MNYQNCKAEISLKRIFHNVTHAQLNQMNQLLKHITDVKFAAAMSSPNMVIILNHCIGTPNHCFSSETSFVGFVVVAVLINITNKHRKKLADLICQNTYWYHVKSALLHFILDAKSMLERPEEQLTWEFWVKRWAHLHVF